MSDPATYRAIQVSDAGELELTERPLLDPPAGEVRIRVEACGICHTDAAAVNPHPETEQGVVPGHEVVGVIDRVGPGVVGWADGDRVGVGFLGGHCGYCDPCRHGNFVRCENQDRTGISRDGGYAEYMTARASGLVRIPGEYRAVAAAPLLCAGLTTYKAILGADVESGDTVAVQGIGGLGHLGVQYANKMGMKTVAIARGTEKEPFALELGADHYVDASDPEAAVDSLKALGGADLILATASSGAASSALVGGIATDGELVVVGASDDPVTVSTGELIGRGVTVTGSLTGSPVENEENLAFAAREGVEAMIEEMPLADAPAGFARMLAGDDRTPRDDHGGPPGARPPVRRSGTKTVTQGRATVIATAVPAGKVLPAFLPWPTTSRAPCFGPLTVPGLQCARRSAFFAPFTLLPARFGTLQSTTTGAGRVVAGGVEVDGGVVTGVTVTTGVAGVTVYSSRTEGNPVVSVPTAALLTLVPNPLDPAPPPPPALLGPPPPPP
jgi:alcohol dehydrogenase, propanol-preferring